MRPVILLLSLLAFCFQHVIANISEPPKPRGGNIAGDSYLANMSVLKEELGINLSGIDQGLPVRIQATYTIECEKLLTNVELIFVANNLTESRYKVEIDGHFVNGYLNSIPAIPGSWIPPDSIPWRNTKIPFIYKDEGLIKFRFDTLTPGIHKLFVDYDAAVSEWYTESDFSKTNTFVYILRPTDSWKKFENLHVVVFIPNEWEFKSNLNLEKATTFSYSGNWKSLPADYISVAINKPGAVVKETYSYLFMTASWLLYAGLIISWMYSVAKYRMKYNKTVWLQRGNAVIVSLLTAVFFFFIFFKNEALVKRWMGNQLNPFYTYGTGYYIMAFPIVFLIALMVVFIVDIPITHFATNKLKTARFK